MDEEKTQVEKVEARPNPRFYCGNDETEKTMEKEEDLPLGTIHMRGAPNNPDLENRIRGEIRMIR